MTVAKQPSTSALDVPQSSFIPLFEPTAADTERVATLMLPLQAATPVDLHQFAHVETRSPSPIFQRPLRIDSPTHQEHEHVDRTHTSLLKAYTIDLKADVVITEPARPSHRRPFFTSAKDDWMVLARTTTSTPLSTTAVLTT